MTYDTLDFTDCQIDQIIIHQVGNKTNDEDLTISKSQLEAGDARLEELLIKYFLHPFSNTEFYNFTFSNGDFKLNPLYQFAKTIFSPKGDFKDTSIDIARHLYEIAVHPQIKSGDLFIATFSGIRADNVPVNALGIFKSENRQPFLKVNRKSNAFDLQYEDGINIDKLDKGCLVLNAAKENGYKVCVIDKSNKSAEAQYWKETFLNVKPLQDEYHYTKEFLGITKQYITRQLSDEFEVSKADQIDLLNKSVEYFKSKDEFDKKEFEQEVFGDKELIKSFREFDQTYREENAVELSDNFEISTQAVKKQIRAFKSVLKLDKNFHIYIHGDKELIEQGVEEDGRKYYKIYYKEEN